MVIIMNSCKNRLYLQELYYKGGCAVLDYTLECCRGYINYSFMDSIIKNIADKPQNRIYILYDKYHIFFHHLCQKLCSEVYIGDSIVFTLSDIHCRDVFCSMLIADKNSYFVNCGAKGEFNCNELYTISDFTNIEQGLAVAEKLFIKNRKCSG